MQFVPLNRINPRITTKHELNGRAQHLLKKACYDCHSNETRWTLLAYIAPASWVISSAVSSGRTALNFSSWKNYTMQEKKLFRKKIEWIVLDGTAHQPLYYALNTTKAITHSENQAVLQWVNEL